MTTVVHVPNFSYPQRTGETGSKSTKKRILSEKEERYFRPLNLASNLIRDLGICSVQKIFSGHPTFGSTPWSTLPFRAKSPLRRVGPKTPGSNHGNIFSYIEEKVSLL